jgi:hypothetical protein
MASQNKVGGKPYNRVAQQKDEKKMSFLLLFVNVSPLYPNLDGDVVVCSMKHHQPMNAEMYCRNCLMVIIKYFNRYSLTMQSLQQITSKLPISKKPGFYYFSAI